MTILEIQPSLQVRMQSKRHHADNLACSEALATATSRRTSSHDSFERNLKLVRLFGQGCAGCGGEGGRMFDRTQFYDSSIRTR